MSDRAARVLLIRPRPSEATDEIDRDAEALRRGAQGAGLALDAVVDPYLEVTPISDDDAPERIARLRAALEPGSWLVATSAMGPRCLQVLTDESFAQPRVRAAAVGPSTAAAVRALGFSDVLIPDVATGRALADRLLQEPAGTAVIPQGNQALPVVADRLRAGGWTVITETVYETRIVTTAPATANAVERGEFDLVVLRSPSAARALRSFVPRAAVPVVVSGPTTRAEAKRLELVVLGESTDSTAGALADAVVAALRARMPS